MRQRHARVLTPSIFIAQDPQIPSRHDRRKVKVESDSFLILINASSTLYAKFTLVFPSLKQEDIKRHDVSP